MMGNFAYHLANAHNAHNVDNNPVNIGHQPNSDSKQGPSRCQSMILRTTYQSTASDYCKAEHLEVPSKSALECPMLYGVHPTGQLGRPAHPASSDNPANPTNPASLSNTKLCLRHSLNISDIHEITGEKPISYSSSTRTQSLGLRMRSSALMETGRIPPAPCYSCHPHLLVQGTDCRWPCAMFGVETVETNGPRLDLWCSLER